MPKATSNHDLRTFEVGRFLDESKDGTQVRAEIFSEVTKQMEKKWLPKYYTRVGNADQRLSDVEYYECATKIKIPYWLAFGEGLV